MPFRILSRPTLMRLARVSSFFGEVTQQIHSFFANGVISAHNSLAARLPLMALPKSAGSLCMGPLNLSVHGNGYSLTASVLPDHRG